MKKKTENIFKNVIQNIKNYINAIKTTLTNLFNKVKCIYHAIILLLLFHIIILKLPPRKT